jgi:hypothetical protein
MSNMSVGGCVLVSDILQTAEITGGGAEKKHGLERFKELGAPYGYFVDSLPNHIRKNLGMNKNNDDDDTENNNDVHVINDMIFDGFFVPFNEKNTDKQDKPNVKNHHPPR